MSLTHAQLQAVIETCEFDRWMGLKIKSLDESIQAVVLPLRTEFVGTPKIKHLHGGGVAVKSVPGEGTVFDLCFPVEKL